MATPLSADRVLAALRAEGLSVVEHRSWRTHNRNHKGLFGPVHGVVIHHTVSSADDSSVELCYNGHSSLPGPLCHGVGRNDGKIALVGHGRANHAGSGDGDVLRAVINETALPADNETDTDGNRHFYGLEIVNLGNGTDTYPWGQYVAAVKWATAHCRAHGWSEKSVIGHKEWQPGKIDPHGPVLEPDGGRFSFDMNRFRGDVKAALALPAGQWQGSATTPPEEEDVAFTAEDAKKVWNSDSVPALAPPYNNADWEDGNREWSARYALYLANRSGRETLYRVRDMETALADVKAKVDTLATGGVDPDAIAALVADKVADLIAARLAE